jgi:hypothetical protein
VITASLSLAVRLIDTTTGRELSEADVRFIKDGNLMHPIKKGISTYVFVNMGREDFLMQISARGFEDSDVSVRYELLDHRLPVLDVFLMPSEKNHVGGQVLQICGTLSELEFIEAIYLSRPIGLFHSFTEKKENYRMNVLPILAGGRVALDSMAYALLSKNQERYEVFRVIEFETPSCVRIREPLKEEHELNDRIFRIIYGRAGPDGSFRLKIRDDASGLPYLLHFKSGENEYFRPVDFKHESGEIDLLKGATKVESSIGKDEEENE